jgi:preprotein translocase subunit SecA
MKPIYDFLGMSVGIIQHDMPHEERKKAYQCDITYGTNNEYGFDYLRDNMVSFIEHKVQRSHNFAIVDEVDSILIDEARTPLIISGPAEESTEMYLKINKIIPKLIEKEDFEIDEKARNATLTEAGVHHIEKILGIDNLYNPENVEMVHHVHQALKAHKIFQRDVDYVVQGGEVVIVDEFTGRLMSGRRYSDGLHQALEAKENVKIARESQTLASITFQNYFRIYTKLAGMTGTADTEAEEFKKIYNLDVVVIPPNVVVQRIDAGDRVYRTEKEKFNAIIQEIKDRNAKKQPILVGTISIEKSELLSKILFANGLPHNVLNAKFHEKEAEIIANAGKPGAITIATNMAGRGTDIVLGGSQKYKEKLEQLSAESDEFRISILKLDLDKANQLSNSAPEILKKKYLEIIKEAEEWKKNHNIVIEAGGLHIVGTERHESRRIDNQLRGRSGRQGDPGSSRFYLSLQDDLMRIFGSDRISNIMLKLNMPEGQEIEHSLVSNAIARSQKRVEGHNFDIRKHLLEYDDVMNQQRIFIYKLRNSLLNRENISKTIEDFFEDAIESQVLANCDGNNPDGWNWEGLEEWTSSLGLDLSNVRKSITRSGEAQMQIFDTIKDKIMIKYSDKKKVGPEEVWQQLEVDIFLDILDRRWKDHLYTMDHLREGIWAVGYSEKNPLVEYKLQGFKLFRELVDSLKLEILTFLMRLELTIEERPHPREESKEYKKIGEEISGKDVLGEATPMGKPKSPILPPGMPSPKATVTTTTSSGGASKPRTGRRKDR